jgi:tetratricopeptide (TPR) repeat protein
MTTRRNEDILERGAKGCFGVFVVGTLAAGLVICLLVVVFVLPAAVIGHVLHFTPSAAQVAKQLVGENHDANWDKSYPHLVLRFIAVDVGLLVVLMLIRRSRKSPEPPAKVADVHEPQTASEPSPDTGSADGDAAPLESGEPLTLPPLSIPDAWLRKPGVKLRVHLVDPAPEPVDSIEQVYAAGLAALSKDEVLAALEHFRSVIAQDPDGTYATARLFTLLLSAEVGDVVSLRVLIGPCMSNAQPDAFAQRAIEKSGLDFYSRAESDGADIVVGECLDQPAIAAQVALAGCFLAVDQTAAAVAALVEDGIPVWEARHAAWEAQSREIDVGMAKHLHDVLYERLAKDEPMALVNTMPLRGTPTEVRERAYIDLHPEITDEAIRRNDALLDRSAPRGPAGSLVGFDDTVCWLYAELNDSDAIIEYVKRYPRWMGSELHRVNALVSKGLPDAALVVLDDYLRNPDSQGWANFARYRKATILLDQGDRQRAKRELAKLYADDPDYQDSQGLRAKLDARAGRSSRATIPEEVRHAVWRRDEARCAQCGSQENLEYDHIIPVSRGGANTERNLQLLCEPCNRCKGADV